MAREQAGRQKAKKKHPGAGPRNSSAGSNISTARTICRGFRGGVVAGSISTQLLLTSRNALWTETAEQQNAETKAQNIIIITPKLTPAFFLAGYIYIYSRKLYLIFFSAKIKYFFRFSTAKVRPICTKNRQISIHGYIM
jgi:hypothetical protein